MLECVLLALAVYRPFRGWPRTWDSVIGMYWDIGGDLVPWLSPLPTTRSLPLGEEGILLGVLIPKTKSLELRVAAKK